MSYSEMMDKPIQKIDHEIFEERCDNCGRVWRFFDKITTDDFPHFFCDGRCRENFYENKRRFAK